MPTITSANVPPPKSWDEFEDILLSAAKLRWGSTDFQRNGRQGQEQMGVDVFGRDKAAHQIGVQGKNSPGGLALKTINEEIAKAEEFKPSLDHLCVATTAPRDAKLQEEVRLLSQKRERAGQFPISILFWDDIVHDLSGDDIEFFKHFPQFRPKVSEKKAHDRALFDEMTKLLSSDGVIGFLDRTNMAGFLFKRSALEPLFDFHCNWNKPEREYLIPELENLRRELLEKSDIYLKTIAHQTWVSDNSVEYQTVPPEWEVTQPDRFREVVNTLHTLAGEIVKLHAEFVRSGRNHLLD